GPIPPFVDNYRIKIKEFANELSNMAILRRIFDANKLKYDSLTFEFDTANEGFELYNDN
ncbi:28360_t:CDS:1, partial [Racocetra persica]